MRTRKLRRMLQASFGKIPEPSYFDGDMNHIRAYYDERKEQRPEAFFLDEITWNDLDMDRVFRRINPKRCTPGEQVLYDQLRSPALEKEEYERRKALIDYAGADPERRLRAELILARLGCSRRADLSRAFLPAEHGAGRLLLYLSCVLLLLASIVCTAAGFIPYAVVFAVFLNCFVHEFGKRRSQRDYDAVNYVVNMVFAVRNLRRLRDAELDRHMQRAYESLDRLRAVIRTGGVSTGMDSGGAGDVLLTVTLLDLITYEYLKTRLGRCREEVLAIHEALGRLDAAISVASYRASLPVYAIPVLDFDGGRSCRIRAAGLRHPLLSDPVPNDCITDRSMLITGSNASGKSTYLKTTALAAILAQSICTVSADEYEATAFRVFSSMSLQDDLLAGESRYIVEIKALKRILDAAGDSAAVLCVVDELLRGTNTVERIAASCELLRALSARGALCLAATHDEELCTLLETVCRPFHFEEQIDGDEMSFDYRLREGRSETHNAIALLGRMGFEPEITERALARAENYRRLGHWNMPDQTLPKS